MSARAPKACTKEMSHAMPPYSVNCCRESASAVTRATNTPRFSSLCSAIESLWMCANVRTRRFMRASSEARTRRRPAARAARNATATSSNASPQMP